jgi:hypothetical protein
MKEDRYKSFDAIAELTKLKCVYDDNQRLEYNKMVQTGDLDFCDYGAGFLNLEVFITNSQEERSKWEVRIWVATIDDGDLGGWSLPMSIEEARKLVHKIANEVMKTLVKFPTLDEFNKQLMPYGMMIGYE